MSGIKNNLEIKWWRLHVDCPFDGLGAKWRREWLLEKDNYLTKSYICLLINHLKMIDENTGTKLKWSKILENKGNNVSRTWDEGSSVGSMTIRWNKISHDALGALIVARRLRVFYNTMEGINVFTLTKWSNLVSLKSRIPLHMLFLDETWSKQQLLYNFVNQSI